MLQKTTSPLDLAASIAQLAQLICGRYAHRLSPHVQRYTDELECKVKLLQSQYEGELVECVTDMFDTLLEILTCPSADYEACYYDLWDKIRRLERESYHLRAQATPRSAPSQALISMSRK